MRHFGMLCVAGNRSAVKNDNDTRLDAGGLDRAAERDELRPEVR